MSNFGLGGSFAAQQNAMAARRREEEAYSHGPSKKKEPSLWERMADAMKNYSFSYGNGKLYVEDERDGVRDYAKHPLGSLPGDDNPDQSNAPWVRNLMNLAADEEEDQEMAELLDVNDPEPRHVESLIRDEERKSVSATMPRVPIKDTTDQMKLLQDTITKLEKKPNQIDFSMLASYFGMDPRPFKPDMTKWEKEKAILGLKEKMAELKSNRELALEKQEYIMQRERIRQAERAKDRQIKISQIKERYGAKAAKSAKKLVKDQEILNSRMKSQHKGALNYLAQLQHDIDPEDPAMKPKARAYSDILHREVIEEAKAEMKADPNLKFSDAYRMVIDDLVAIEEEEKNRRENPQPELGIPGV